MYDLARRRNSSSLAGGDQLFSHCAIPCSANCYKADPCAGAPVEELAKAIRGPADRAEVVLEGGLKDRFFIYVHI